MNTPSAQTQATSRARLRPLFALADFAGGKPARVALRARPVEPRGPELRPLYTDGECFACLSEYMGVKASADIRRSGGFRENGAHFLSVARDRRLAGTVMRKRRHIMSNHAVEAGWQRFLDRLKQLWGKLSQGDKPSAAAG